MDADLRQQCHTFIAGNHEPDPATLFRQMADWCQEHDAVHDAYGEGKPFRILSSRSLSYWALRPRCL